MSHIASVSPINKYIFFLFLKTFCILKTDEIPLKGIVIHGSSKTKCSKRKSYDKRVCQFCRNVCFFEDEMQLKRHFQKTHFDHFEDVIFKNYLSVNEFEEQLAKDALLEMEHQLFGLEDYMVLVDNDLKVI